MSDEPAQEAAAPPRRPVQFTVRTFFAAAVLISLFAAAARLPSEESRICGLTFLAWLTAVGFVRIIGARLPLIALLLAPMVLAAGWMLSLPSRPTGRRSEIEGWMVLPGASVWGIAISIVVTLAAGLARLGKRLGIGSLGGARQPPPSASRTRRPSPAWELAAAMVFLRLILSGIQTVVTAMVPRHRSTWEAALGAAFLIDGPLAPFYYGLYPSPPQTARGMILVTTVLGVPLYGAMGWLIGRWAKGGRAPATLQGRAGAHAPTGGKGTPGEGAADTG